MIKFVLQVGEIPNPVSNVALGLVKALDIVERLKIFCRRPSIFALE